MQGIYIFVKILAKGRRKEKKSKSFSLTLSLQVQEVSSSQLKIGMAINEKKLMFTLVARKNDATPISCRYSVLNLAFDKHLKVNGMGIDFS